MSAYSDALGARISQARQEYEQQTAQERERQRALVALGGPVPAVLPQDPGIGTRLNTGVLAVVGGAGVWTAVRSYRRRDSS